MKLPPEMLASLRVVHAMIERRDDVATLPTDDFIQAGPLCVGLMDDGSGQPDFSGHLEGNSPYVWDIALRPAEILAIVAGTLDQIPLWCCTNPNCGFKTYMDDVTYHWCEWGGDRTGAAG